MKKFAKLFEHKTMGQILITRDIDDDGDEGICFMFRVPNQNMCKMWITASKDETADAMFDRTDEEVTLKIVKQIWDTWPRSVTGELIA